MDTAKIISELEAQHDRIVAALAALEGSRLRRSHSSKYITAKCPPPLVNESQML